MFARPTDRTISCALIAGVVLAVMTDWNSQLARHSSPLFASWTAHGVGMAASITLVMLLSPKGNAEHIATSGSRWPLLSYLGGIPGAFTVLLAAITVNSALGLAGTLALLLLGQMAFGAVADYFGLFGLQRRRPQPRQAAGFVLVLLGSMITLLAQG
jgi:bacterial/archaeal transporter family-2 protein